MKYEKKEKIGRERARWRDRNVCERERKKNREREN